MMLTVNRREIEYEGEPTVATFARLRHLPEEGVAIALNGNVLRRADWSQAELREGDEIEVVHAIAGG